jgi:hypothetical protein
MSSLRGAYLSTGTTLPLPYPVKKISTVQQKWLNHVRKMEDIRSLEQLFYHLPMVRRRRRRRRAENARRIQS